MSQLADRLEVAPTTVSLMVGDLSRHGILTRDEDDADRRRRIVAIAPDYAAPITQWLSGNATAWTEVLAACWACGARRAGRGARRAGRSARRAGRASPLRSLPRRTTQSWI